MTAFWRAKGEDSGEMGYLDSGFRRNGIFLGGKGRGLRFRFFQRGNDNISADSMNAVGLSIASFQLTNNSFCGNLKLESR